MNEKNNPEARTKKSRAEAANAVREAKNQHGSAKMPLEAANRLAKLESERQAERASERETENGTPRSAVDNEWTSTALRYYPDERERRDGPGGEDKDR